MASDPATDPLNRRPMRRLPMALVIALVPVLAAVASLPALAAPLRIKAPAVPAIDWKPCFEEFEDLQCATVQVPLDYRKPFGAKTDLAVARILASDSKNKIGTLFLNPGGPGASGVDLIFNGFGDYLNEALLGKFDIMGWDPRGTGESTPIQCWNNDDIRDAYFQDLPTFPYLANQEANFFARYRNIAYRCASRKQPIFKHMSTADVARDLDLLRQAVGDERLNYLGYSYGSFIGNTYANLYPKKVRAMVIDGVLDPNLWSSGWQIKADRSSTDEVLQEFFNQCDQAGPDCYLSGPSGSKARFDAILAVGRRQTIVIGEGDDIFEYAYDELVGDAIGAMYTPEIWPSYADFLDLLSIAMQGDKTASKKALLRYRAIQQKFRDAGPVPRSVYDNSLEAYFGNHCADAGYPSGFKWYSAISKYADAGSFVGPSWWWNNATCAAWPTARNRYTGPWKTTTSAPVLVIGNYYDPATNYAGAVASNRQLRNSRLLSYAGWGHTAAFSGRSACTDDYVIGYLLDGDLPAPGTICPAAANPFVYAKSRAKAGKAVPMPMVGLPTLRPQQRR